jgi:hypothetical protein
LSASELNGRSRVKQLLDVLNQFPIMNLAKIFGKSNRSFLSEITGLSVSRIAKGGLDALRPSTARRVEAYASAWGHSKAKEKGWNEEDFSSYIATIPKMRNGGTAGWATWVYSLQYPDHLLLPLTISCALEIDELIFSLSNAFNINDCQTFSQAILEMSDSNYEKSLLRSSAEYTEKEIWVKAWRSAADWDAIGPLLSQVVDNILIGLYAALDVEWARQYLQIMVPMPIFLWLAPRVNEDLDLDSGTKVTRNLIYRPVRRLLEFSHALAHWHYRKHWPKAPAGRSELGRALGLSDADVGNYFDGTRKLTIVAYQSYWIALCRHFGPLSQLSEMPICPNPLGVVAITWQWMLIITTDESKFKSAHLLDEENYKRQWQGHRNYWPEQASSDDVAWPDWLLDQSLLSDSMRSSQSSGHSSSPRECQYSS